MQIRTVSATAVVVAGVVVVVPGGPAWAGRVDVVGLTARDVAEGLAGGEFTSVDLVRSFRERISVYEPYYNAFTFFNADALADAAALDAEYEANGPRSPLHGVPIVIKEAMDVKGLPSTVGWAPLARPAGGVELIPETDAPLVKRLREAGAVILGKTNIPAFSFSGTDATSSWDGDTFNAFDRTIAPGASSAGTATAVAGSFAVLGMAEETGGSIQNPAAAQGLVGVKPTFALIANAGVAPLAANTRDVVGPHAKTVYDAAVTLDALAGYDIEDPKTIVSVGKVPEGGYTSELSTTALAGKRFGTFGQGWKDVTLTPETQALYDRSIDELEAQGATFVADPFAGTNFKGLIAATPNGFEATAYEFDQFLARLGPSNPINSVEELLEATGRNPFDPGEPLAFIGSIFPDAVANPTDPPDLAGFFEARTALLDAFADVMEANDLDGLIFPQMSKPTPDLAGDEQIGATTVSEINLLGTPGVTVPAGFFEDGSPFGLIFLGEQFSEAELLGYAFDYEQATMYRADPQLIPLPPALWSGVAVMIGGSALARVRRRRRVA